LIEIDRLTDAVFANKQARKVIVERLRRERIDRCLDQLKHWLQDSTLDSQVSQHN